MKPTKFKKILFYAFMFTNIFCICCSKNNKERVYSWSDYKLFESVNIIVQNESIFWTLNALPVKIDHDKRLINLKLRITGHEGDSIATWPDYLVFNLHDINPGDANDFYGRTLGGRIFAAPLGLLDYKEFDLEKSFVIWLEVFFSEDTKYSPVFIKPYYFNNYTDFKIWSAGNESEIQL